MESRLGSLLEENRGCLTNPKYQVASGSDTNMKKCTTFVKKIRTVTAETLQSLKDEAVKLKLDKYKEEIAQSCAAVSPSKASDCAAAVDLTSFFYRLFRPTEDDEEMQVSACFHGILGTSLMDRLKNAGEALQSCQRTLEISGIISVTSTESENAEAWGEVATAQTNLRVAYRYALELHLVGVLSGGENLGSLITSRDILPVLGPLAKWTRIVGENSEEAVSTVGPCRFVPLVTFICKNYGELLLPSPSDAEKKDVYTVSTGVRTAFDEMVKSLWREQIGLLKRVSLRYRRIQRRERTVYETKGDLSDRATANLTEAGSRLAKLKEILLAFGKTIRGVENSDAQIESSCAAGDDEVEQAMLDGKIVFVQATAKAEDDDPLWDNDEEKSLYETLPDLTKLLPPHLVAKLNLNVRGGQEDGDEKANADDVAMGELPESMDPESANLIIQTTPTTKQGSKAKTSSVSSVVDASNMFIPKLDNAFDTRESTDEAAVEFLRIYFASTANSATSLVTSTAEKLLTMPKTRPDLVPQVARFLAIVKPHVPTVAELVVTSVLGQSRFLALKKREVVPGKVGSGISSSTSSGDHIVVAVRTRVSRFLGELVKFRVAGQGQVFTVLRLLITENLDGVYHPWNVDSACSLLDACGRWLMKQPASVRRMHWLLDALKKKKDAVNSTLSPHHNAAIEATLTSLHTKRSAGGSLPIKIPKPPLHLYIRYLLRNRLNKSTAPEVLNKLARIPWSNEEDVDFLRRCILRVDRVRFESITLVAGLVRNLSTVHGHSDFAVSIVDDLVEAIRTYVMALHQHHLLSSGFNASLPIWLQRMQQRAMAQAALLAELYCQMVISQDTFVTSFLAYLLTAGFTRLPTPGMLCRYPGLFIARLTVVSAALHPIAPYLQNDSYTLQLYSLIQYYMAVLNEDHPKILAGVMTALLDASEKATQVSATLYTEGITAKTALTSLLGSADLADRFIASDPKPSDQSTAAIEENEEVKEPEEEKLNAETLQERLFDRIISELRVEATEARKLEGRRTEHFHAPFMMPTNSSDQDNNNNGGGTIKLLMKKKNKPITKEIRFAPHKN